METGDLATWVGSVGVVATFAATGFALVREAVLRRRSEVRSQAEHVAAWYDGDSPESSWLAISNSSALPIYEVIVSLVFVQGSPPSSIKAWTAVAGVNGPSSLPFGKAFTAVGPGEFRVPISRGWAALTARPGCEVAFRDASGRNWIRDGWGTLTETRLGPIDAVGMVRPVDFEAPRQQPLA